MPAGSKIILCVAEPAWVYSGLRGLQAYESFAFFERETIHRYGHHHVVGIGSDLHAYARYESADGRQRFVSGGGGACGTDWRTSRSTTTSSPPPQPAASST